jgi:hypothetical protein
MLTHIWLGLDYKGDIVHGGHNRPRLYIDQESALKFGKQDTRIKTIVRFAVEESLWTRPPINAEVVR